MISECGWCGRRVGETVSVGATIITSGICPECYLKSLGEVTKVILLHPEQAHLRVWLEGAIRSPLRLSAMVDRRRRERRHQSMAVPFDRRAIERRRLRPIFFPLVEVRDLDKWATPCKLFNP